jgi:outer membrane usher protein
MTRFRWAQPLARALFAFTSVILGQESAEARLPDTQRLSDPDSDRLYAKPSAPPPPVPDTAVPNLKFDLAALSTYESEHADVAARVTFSAQPEPTAIEPGPEMLALLPLVNGVAGNQALVVERDAQNHFRVAAGELRALRIKADPKAGDGERIDLASLPGLVAGYEESTQSLKLKVPDALLMPIEVNAGGQPRRTRLSDLRTTPSVQLSYNLAAIAESGDRTDVRLAGDVAFVGTSGLATLVGNALISSSRRNGVIRGESFFRIEDPEHVRTYTLGDVTSGAVNFTRSVRLGGVQVQSNFQERPDLFRGPLPQFAASAALPSALDLFVDGLKVYSGKVPQGPFLVNSLPAINGNELKIVTTDATGRQTEVTTQLFNAPDLLRKGLVEYSLEAGAPRIDQGLRSFGYINKLFASGTLRYGVSNRMTLEGHAEAGDGLYNSGLGVVRDFGLFGALNGGAAFSRFRGRNGVHVEGVYRLDFPRFTAFASATRNYGEYFDLGDVSSIAQRARRSPGIAAALRGQQRSAERVGVTLRPSFDPVSINLAYSRIRVEDSRFRTANIAVTRRISRNISFRGDAAYDLEKRGDFALRLGLDFRFGRFGQAFAGGDYRNGRVGYTASLTEFNAGRQNAVGYSLLQRGEDGNTFRSASLNYRLPQAFVSGSINQAGNDVRGSFNIQGSVVAAGGSVFLANRIGDGFAIVRNAGAGTGILQNGRRIAKANGSGGAFLPALQPFNENRVGIDPASLAPGFEPAGGAEFRVVPARHNGAIIDFGVRKVFAAIVVLTGRDGKVLPPGTQVLREGQEPEIVGYDGEVFLRNLSQRNKVTIMLSPSESCTAEFEYQDGEFEQPRIGPVKCI